MEQQVSDLLTRMPRTAIRAAINEIERSGGGQTEKGTRLKGVLVSYFNHLRPHKARRLFTTLFEPLLADDPLLFHAIDSVPGLLQRADIGGIWHALSQLAFPDLAMEVQRELDRLSQDQILDVALATPEALALRERMRAEAVAFLTVLPVKRRVLDSFLQIANRAALKEAKTRQADLEQKAAVDLSMVTFVTEVLVHNDRVIRDIETFRKSVANEPESEPEKMRQARVAHALCQQFKTHIEGVAADSPVRYLPLLIQLNNLRRFDVVGKYLSHLATIDGPDQVVIARAVTGHLVGACRTMVAQLKELVSPSSAEHTPTLEVPTAMRTLLEEALLRFDRAINLLHLGDGANERRTIMQLKEHLGDISALLIGPVLDRVERQAIIAASMRVGGPEADDPLRWLLNFLWRWGKVLVSVGYSNQEIENLKFRIGEDVERAYRAALRFSDADNLETRMGHLVRLNQIMRSFDADIGPWISAVSASMQKIVRHYLDRTRPPTDDERFVIETCIRAIQEELEKSRYWQATDLVDLVRLYGQRRW